LIVGAQVALSLVLLVSGGLLLRTFLKLVTLDLGFDKHNVLVVTAKPQWFAADTAKVPREKRAALYEQIATRLRALPGVISVARAFTTPLGDDNWVNDIQPDVPNGPTGDAADAYFNYVSPEYFATLRMPLISGRDFSDTDTRDSAPVAIVNQTLARMFFPGVNPLGRHFRRGGYKQVWEIVGVVKDAKYESVKEETRPTAFLPVSQVPLRTGAEEFALRTLLPPSSLVRSVQQAISEVDGGIPLEFHALAEQVDDDLIRERLLATLAGFFGALALLLAMIGLYGVLSYVVTQRQVEFGIRMALGAAPASILRLVLRDVARLVIAGLSVGLAMCVPITRLMRAMLFGLQPHDIFTIIGAVVLLSSMAFVAGYLPARRATRIDPLVALRYE
jgi:predicted permease